MSDQGSLFRREVFTALLTVLLTSAAPAFAQTVGGQPAVVASPVQSLAAVVVTAPQSPWWTVTSKGHVLVVIGVPDLLPTQANWKTALFGNAPLHAQYLIKAPDISFHMGFSWLWKRNQLATACQLGTGQRLHDMLDAADYAQWQELWQHYGHGNDGIDHEAPGCAARKLWRRFIVVNELNGYQDVRKHLTRFVRTHAAKIVRPDYWIKRPQYFAIAQAKQFDNPGLDCMKSVLIYVGRDLPRIRLQNRLWSAGHIARSFAVPLAVIHGCGVTVQDGDVWSGIPNPFAMARLRWVDDAQAMLCKYTFGIAVLSYGNIKDGYLESLKKRGYTVHTPEDIVDGTGTLDR